MATRVATAVRPSEVQTQDLPLIGAVPRGPAEVHRQEVDWILPIIGRAIDRTMPRKEAAFLMGLDASLMTRQLQGDGHLSIRRLGALPESFWLSLADELRAHYGMLDRAQLIEQAEALSDRARQLFAKACAR